jgi:hypothetical protein
VIYREVYSNTDIMLHRNPATAAYASLHGFASSAGSEIRKAESSNEDLFAEFDRAEGDAVAVDLGVGSGAAKRNLIVGVRWGGQGKEEPSGHKWRAANAMPSLHPSRISPDQSRSIGQPVLSNG